MAVVPTGHSGVLFLNKSTKVETTQFTSLGRWKTKAQAQAQTCAFFFFLFSISHARFLILIIYLLLLLPYFPRFELRYGRGSKL